MVWSGETPGVRCTWISTSRAVLSSILRIRIFPFSLAAMIESMIEPVVVPNGISVMTRVFLSSWLIYYRRGTGSGRPGSHRCIWKHLPVLLSENPGAIQTALPCNIFMEASMSWREETCAAGSWRQVRRQFPRRPGQAARGIWPEG